MELISLENCIAPWMRAGMNRIVHYCVVKDQNEPLWFDHFIEFQDIKNYLKINDPNFAAWSLQRFYNLVSKTSYLDMKCSPNIIGYVRKRAK